jgi:thiol-disulfide isomerase/thioredoxin
MFAMQRCLALSGVLLAAALSGSVFAVEDKQTPAEEPATEKAAKEEPAKEKADRFAVPEGTPKELIEYVQKLIATPPRDDDTRKKMQQAILQAAEKILADKPGDEEMEFAVEAKMNMLENPEQLAAFAAELKASGHEKPARQVHGFMLQLALRKALTGGREPMQKAIEDVIAFLEKDPPQSADVGLAFTAGRLAEMSGDNDLAVNTYRSLAKAFAASKDPKLVEFSEILAGVTRRLSLVGHPMKIEGKLLDGSTFDWSKYQGKVVLVDFWATWCGPCLREIPNMMECYELYHDKGFEIVGLSLDPTLADLEAFVKEKKIPWTIVFGDGKPSLTASYYGVLAIPTTILVGKDGKVVSLNVRGESLRSELEKLLGPADKKKEPKSKEAASDK